MEIKLFYLEDCPYCHNAKKALNELIQENPKYAEIAIEWIEESEQSDLASKYDYYFVPTIFEGKQKLYEAKPKEKYIDCKLNIQKALDKVLKR